jgi:SpoVK/Ycf46/Vps4 family AAA+-type ATPase
MVRSLRNALEILKAKGTMIIFIGPVIKIPIELDKDIQLLDFSLPTEKAIEERLEHIRKSVEKNNKEKKIDLPEDIKQAAIEAAKGMTASEVENAFTLAIVERQKFDNGFVKTVFTEKVQQVKKMGLLNYIESDVDFSHVGGLDALKIWMKVRAKAFTAEARKYGLPYPKGTLLCGIPGCGKSLIAKATANEFGFPLFQLDVGALFGKHVGETEENFRKVVSTVEGIGRCILYIDEIEKALNKDAVSGKGDTGTSSRSFGTLLTWLSDHKSPVFVIGTSNNHTILPPEMTRKGRFDELFWLDLPDDEERMDIFKVILNRYQRDPKNFNLKTLAKSSKGFTGSEIENVVVTAMFNKFAADGKDIDNQSLMDEIAETIPIAKTCEEDIENMRKQAAGKLRIAVKDGSVAAFEKGLRKIEV